MKEKLPTLRLNEDFKKLSLKVFIRGRERGKEYVT